ncbi:MAG: hypothetical protein LAN62_13855 [Acidobacteriia bacterium]|nr:hypothetical protein [Terriglobia bacterium]
MLTSQLAPQLLPAAMGVAALALGYVLVRVSAPWRARGVSGFRGSFHIELMFSDLRLFAGIVLGALGYFLMLGGGILTGVGLILAFL